uniref:Aminopeptidase n=1 Tax=Steinernema glaseri TaxID=37863 RepID=A0A1I8AAU5_9BILA
MIPVALLGLLALAGFTTSLDVFDPIANPIGPGPLAVPTETNFHRERAYKQQLDVAAAGKPRIPHDVRAVEYNITIHPYFPAPNVVYSADRNFTFDGRVRFQFEVLEDIEFLQLDAQNIDLAEVYAYYVNGDKMRLSYVTYDSKVLRYTVAPLLGFDSGKQYIVEMVYRGKINHYTDAGLFYTTFIDKAGSIHYLVATHMENGFGAKSVFPCIDDPSFKAHFQITLNYPDTYVPLSNTREYYGSSIGNGYLQVQFPKSIFMSTYLVAFATGEFVSKKAYTPDNILVRSWAWIGMEDYLQFAADTSAQCLYKMSQFANLTFPMDKTDQLGLPEFPAGAMENYGLIIYKYQYIAYNPRVHSTFNKFNAIRVMCHELSHQWFGDTVTAMWWDDLFLHEGFAAYWEYFAPLMVFPSQGTFLETYFVSDTEETAFRSDADPALSHPIVYKDGPAFDDMTYNKGSSVLRMLKSVLGADTFREGLRRYIAKYKFQNANHEMLFNELTSAANDKNILDWCNRLLNVNKFMDPWVLQQNFPLVSVVHSGSSETLQQAPFSDRSTLPASPYNYSWPIPIFYQPDPASTHTNLTWLPPASDASCHNSGSTYRAGTFHLNNVDTFTFARVRYDDDSFQAIVDALGAQNNISVASKVRLLEDEVVYAKQKSISGHPHPYENLLTLMKLILPNSHPHPAIFETVQKTVDLLEGVLTSKKQHDLYAAFVQKTVGPLCAQLEWEASDNWDQNIARERLLPYCVRYNVPGFVKTAMDYYGKLVGACGSYHNGTDSCNPLHPDIRKAVYCAAAMQNHQNIFLQLITFYVNQYQTDIYFYQEYQALLYGLSCAPNEMNLTSVIHHIANSKLVGSTELFYMATNPIAFQTFYDYLRTAKNMQLVLNANLLDGYLNAMTFNVFDQDSGDKVTALFQSSVGHFNGDQQKTFQKYLNRTTEQIAWADKHSTDIIRWIYDNILNKENQVIWNKRLPEGVAKPTAYTVRIKPYLPGSPNMAPTQNFTFEASSSVSDS